MPKSKLLKQFVKGFLFPMCLIMGIPGTGGASGGAGSAGADGAQEGAGGAQGGAGGEPGAGGNGGEKSFTQADVTRIATAEKAQGRASVLKELGLEDTEEARAAVKAYLEKRESEKSELERAKSSLSKVESEKAAAEAARLVVEHKLLALQEDADPKLVDDLVILATAKVTKEKDFAAVLKEMKPLFPNFFRGGQGGGTGSAHNHGRNGSGGNGGTTSLGERLAQNRANTAAKESGFFK